MAIGRLNQRHWLKSLHILVAATWIGTGFSMILLMTVNALDVHEMYTVWSQIKKIDLLLVALPNFLTLITGLLLSWLTNWGFKHTWIKLKLVIQVSIILFAGQVMRHWIDRAIEVLKSGDPAVLQDPTFLINKQMFLYSTAALEFLLILVVFISVFKPWSRQKGKAD
jgi:uncharacterized membrane protein